MADRNQKGWVFDLQHFSIHDGPGIRTTVFLSGCSLRCKWCQNPESHTVKPVLSFHADKCTACGDCISTCPENAIYIEDNRIHTNRALCTACGNCVPACPAAARSIIGKEMTAAEVLKDAAADKIFYDGSGGGVTLSGGEILVQPEFLKAIIELCREAGISTAVETTGNADWTIVKDTLKDADLVLYDLKHMDPAAHKSGTGAGNKKILENIVEIKKELKIPIFIRIPLIPGYNDSPENLNKTARFVREELGDDTPVNLLPYHRLGLGKWEQLEKGAAQFEAEPPSDEHMEYVRSFFVQYGLDASIGG